MPPETKEVYAYICKGIAGAPRGVYGLHVTSTADDVIRPRSIWEFQSYWALSSDADGVHPAVLIHVFYEGRLPSDQDRDRMRRTIQALVGHYLFGETFDLGPVVNTHSDDDPDNDKGVSG